MIAARMAYPFLKEAESGKLPALPAGLKRFSLNQMAELVLSDAGQADAENVETRIWRPSRPVIHLATAVHGYLHLVLPVAMRITFTVTPISAEFPGRQSKVGSGAGRAVAAPRRSGRETMPPDTAPRRDACCRRRPQAVARRYRSDSRYNISPRHPAPFLDDTRHHRSVASTTCSVTAQWYAYRGMGHTPGHQSLQLRLDGGDIVLAADAYYFCRTLRGRRLPRYMHDRYAMLASLDRLGAFEGSGARISRSLRTLTCRAATALASVS
jgi:hypothetical protein